MLNSVVLPAPLGPMKPVDSARRTAKLTSLTAASPPKYFVQLLDFQNGSHCHSLDLA